MRTVYLLDFLPDGFHEPDGAVVALTPEADYQLRKMGIQGSILEDFLSPNELSALERGYTEILHKWILTLDEKLFEKLPRLKRLDLGPADLYGYYLELLIDPFVVKALQFKTLAEKLSPDRIVFVSGHDRPGVVEDPLSVEERAIPSLLLPPFCAQRHISYEPRIQKRSRPLCADAQLRRWLDRIKRPLRTLRRAAAHALQVFRDDGQGMPFAPGFLFLRMEWGIDKIEQAAKRKGYRTVERVDRFPLRWTVSGPAPSGDDSGFGLEVFDAFAGTRISTLLEGRIRQFICQLAPQLDHAIHYYLDAFRERRVDFVVTPFKAGFDDIAIMAAATAAKGVLSVQIDHGYSAGSAKYWRFTERPCDLWITCNEEVGEYIAESVFLGSATKAAVAEVWTSEPRELGKNRPAPKHLPPVVLYIPCAVAQTNRLDGVTYYQSWYFRHQLDLLRGFARFKDYRFIYKAPPPAPASEKNLLFFELIAQTIREGGYTNIQFEDGPLPGYLAQADYALLDYPTTPLYEAVLASVPTLCLYHDSLNIRDSAKEFFGRILQPFSTPEQAIDEIKRFLSDAPGRYVMNLPYHEGDVLSLIEDSLRKKMKHAHV